MFVILSVAKNLLFFPPSIPLNMTLLEKLVKFLTYSVILLLIGVGILLLAGYFKIDPNLRLIFGFVFIVYGVIRLLTVRRKYKRKNEIQDSGMEK
ncbi:MAG: hypothetical protein A2Z27_03930 [candidate division Zixibacteria bacterium RBG_16_50_21]|nr:MAG: hypothetical protein A2Z27_03930 [candidate division Zixibacteria bacterium RBG_16_50_21]